MMAVPFRGSGLKDADLKNLLDLMEKIKKDLVLPLTDASTQVRKELRELQMKAVGTRDRLSKEDQIVETSDRSSEEQDEEDEYKVNMQTLLDMIDTVSLSQEDDSRGTVFVTVTEFLLISPANAHFDLPGATPGPSDNPGGELPNVYRTPYPLLPSQIGPTGGIDRPFSASFLPTLSPHSGSADVASPYITSNFSPLPSMRYSSQHLHRSVYYPPSSPSLSNLSSNTRFGSSGDGGASSSPPASQEVK